MYYFEEEIAKATNEAGLRGVLGQTIIQFPVADAKTPADGLARAERFIKEFKGDDLIVPAVAPHAMYTLDSATLKACARARDASTACRCSFTSPRREDEVKTRARAAQRDAGGVPRVDRLLGAADACGARRLGRPTTTSRS